MEKWPILVIGGGPAGLSAAINARKRNKAVLVVAKEQVSHKLLAAPKVDNYPGLPGLSGRELGETLYRHALTMGAEFARDEVQQVYRDGDGFVAMGREEQYRAVKVLLSVGVLESNAIPGEAEFIGRGVSYCATCDGAFFRGADVAFISYLPDAESEVRFLAGICHKVYYIPQFKTSGSSLPPNTVVLAGRPKRIEGAGKVERLVIGDQILPVGGVFIERPGVPPARLIDGLAVEGDRIVVTDDLETSVAGIYAAGDCTGRPWQIARAVGQGQVAAIAMAKRLEEEAAP